MLSLYSKQTIFHPNVRTKKFPNPAGLSVAFLIFLLYNPQFIEKWIREYTEKYIYLYKNSNKVWSFADGKHNPILLALARNI